MKTQRFVAIFSCLLAGLLYSSVLAEGPKYADPNKVDADFAYQGEYAGQLDTPDGPVKIGVQVIALGRSKFQAVAFVGGLPGDGSSKEAPVRTQGEFTDGAVKFKSEFGSGSIKDGALSVSGPDGKEMGKLPKVARQSPTLGKKPPAGALVLFDSSAESLQNWKDGRRTEDGLLMEGTTSKKMFGDHSIHFEFRLAYQPEDRGQGRSNSGIYAQGRYEVQILDSFGLDPKDNECGGIYSVKAPDRNMCFPPLSWQTYDIDFTAAKHNAEGKLMSNPRMTVRHNGILIHDNVELPGSRSTTAAPVGPGAPPGPIYLQNHGCPLRYRNIWVVEK